MDMVKNQLLGAGVGAVSGHQTRFDGVELNITLPRDFVF